MKVNVLAFGIAREIFGASSITIELAESSVADLKTSLELSYPKLKALASYLVAVNNEYAGDDLLLDIRDEVAIIPPVSGG